jgi:hypothetical protein
VAGKDVIIQEIQVKTNSFSVLKGKLTLIDERAETLLHSDECAAFPKGTGTGRHLVEVKLISRKGATPYMTQNAARL